MQHTADSVVTYAVPFDCEFAIRLADITVEGAFTSEKIPYRDWTKGAVRQVDDGFEADILYRGNHPAGVVKRWIRVTAFDNKVILPAGEFRTID